MNTRKEELKLRRNALFGKKGSHIPRNNIKAIAVTWYGFALSLKKPYGHVDDTLSDIVGAPCMEEVVKIYLHRVGSDIDIINEVQEEYYEHQAECMLEEEARMEEEAEQWLEDDWVDEE
jgi:hypothetical protein